MTTRMIGTLLLGLLWMATGVAPAQAGTKHYYYTDAQGTVLAKADAQGNIIASYDYAPYGTQVLGTPPSGPAGYTGHVNDAESGFVYMQRRYYDPAVGRFLSVDPVGPGPDGSHYNRYSYVENNPVNKIDPTGMYSCSGKNDECDKVDGFVNYLGNSLNGLKKGSDEYTKVSRVVEYLGTKDTNKDIVINVVSLANKNEMGNAGSGSVLNIDMSAIARQASTNASFAYNKEYGGSIFKATGASVISHEVRHKLDAKAFDPTSSRLLNNRSERNSYRTQAGVNQGLGLATSLWWPGATSNQINDRVNEAAEGSTDVWCEEATVCK